MPVGDIWEVAIRGRIEGQRTVNVRQFRTFSESPGSPLTPAQIATAANAKFATLLKGGLSVNWAWESVRVQKIRPLPVGIAYEDATGAGPGLIAGDSLPSTNAVVITLQTALAGRANRGRVYIPGIPESYSTGSSLNATGQIGLGSFGQAFEDPLISAGGNGSLSAVIFHRALGTTEDILQSRLNSIFGNQRKRRVGLGE